MNFMNTLRIYIMSEYVCPLFKDWSRLPSESENGLEHKLSVGRTMKPAPRTPIH